MPRPCGVPDSSCSSTLRSASGSACSWRCCIIATLAWLPQTVATTSPARTISASRSAWRSAAIASSRRPSCASVTPLSEWTSARFRLITRRVQRRGGLRDVLADDGGVADVAVAEAELVVGEADRARVVRPLRLLQRAGEERDAARRFTLGDRQLAVQAPQLREPGRVQPLALVGRIARALRSPAGCRPAGTTPRRARCGSGGSRRGSDPGCLSARTRSAAASAPVPLLQRLRRLGEDSGQRHGRAVYRVYSRMDRGFTGCAR